MNLRPMGAINAFRQKEMKVGYPRDSSSKMTYILSNKENVQTNNPSFSLFFASYLQYQNYTFFSIKYV